MELTKAQKNIYDIAPDDKWFNKNDVTWKRNVVSQCHKMVEKGFMVSRLVDDYSRWEFKKVRS
jgi:hypothetical protein